MPKKRRSDADVAPSRRSTHACHRCKSKKIKCRFGIGSTQSTTTCISCINSESDCVFDVTPDGIPKGADYVAALESRVATLERELELRAHSGEEQHRLQNSSDAQLGDDAASLAANSRASQGAQSANEPALVPLEARESHMLPSPAAMSQIAIESPSKLQHKIIESMPDGVTIFNFILHPPPTSKLETGGPLPDIPSPQAANSLLHTAYFYIQARYCIVDWVRVRLWHEQRSSICYAAPNSDPEVSEGAYFLWMTYALGAQLVPSSEHSPEGYYARALLYLPGVLAQQNLTTVQGLLVLIQYFYRGPGGPSMWNLVGATMRLCIELGLHRKVAKMTAAETTNPFMVELQKRFFWCAYCFDRSVSILSKRPFGIHDADIDVQFPVDIDVTCVDQEAIRNLQIRQEAGELITQDSYVSSMTACLYHLEIYLLQSRIVTKFTGPRVIYPSNGDVEGLLSELDRWVARATQQEYPPSFPRQSNERIRAIYYLSALILTRPILNRSAIEDSLLKRCAVLASDACENEKALCFSPQTHNSPIRIYNCFRCGLTLLQCLVSKPNIIPVRQALRAINSCSSALAVYTGTLAVARPYLLLFDKLSYPFLGYDDNSTQPNAALRNLLHKVTSCDPSEIPELLNTLSAEEAQQNLQTLMPDTTSMSQGDLMGPDSMGFGMDLMMPFEMLEDSIRPDAFQRDMMSFWSGTSTF